MPVQKSLRVDKDFSKRLNDALDKAGFPPKNKGRIKLLAEMMGLSHRGAGKWLNGETVPPAKKIYFLAEKLNISVEWLCFGKGNMIRESGALGTNPPDLMFKDIPFYTLEDLNNPYRTPLQRIPCFTPSSNKTFAIKIDSEAMFPRIPAGSIIFVDMDRKTKDGDFILMQLEHIPGPQPRQLIISNGVHYLIAANPKFERTILNAHDKILGVIIQIILVF